MSVLMVSQCIKMQFLADPIIRSPLPVNIQLYQLYLMFVFLLKAIYYRKKPGLFFQQLVPDVVAVCGSFAWMTKGLFANLPV
jgi:hypothetical protein